jgi:predicted nuclease of predicted toxin-antitoxin system
MRFLADECVDASLVEQLRAAGHDVQTVQDTAAASDDAAVVALAARENRILLTEDKDFGELAIRQKLRVPGIVLLRIGPQLGHRKWPRLATAIDALRERLAGHHTVVDVDKIRTRPLDH